jgi:hypothetical protein
MNINPPRVSLAQEQETLKHVIHEYRHRAQVVTCVCGWRGSTATPHGGKSAWDQHKAEFRGARA